MLQGGCEDARPALRPVADAECYLILSVITLIFIYLVLSHYSTLYYDIIVSIPYLVLTNTCSVDRVSVTTWLY